MSKKVKVPSTNTNDEDLTLNQKINKVIADIKRLNDQKAKEFGCSLTNNTTIMNNTQISNASNNTQKRDKLMDFIKKEQRKESNKKRIKMLDEQEG